MVFVVNQLSEVIPGSDLSLSVPSDPPVVADSNPTITVVDQELTVPFVRDSPEASTLDPIQLQPKTFTLPPSTGTTFDPNHKKLI